MAGPTRKLLGGGAPTGRLDKGERDRRFHEACSAIEQSGLSGRRKQAALERVARAFMDGQDPLQETSRFGLGPTVKPGYVGVALDRGKPRSGAYPAGIVPGVPGFTRVEEYPVRAQRYDLTVNAISSRKLPIQIDLTVQHKLEPEGVRGIFDNVGPDYVHVLLDPFLTQAVRRICYGKKEEEIMDPAFADDLTALLQGELAQVCLDVRITVRVVRPPSVITELYEQLAQAEFKKEQIGAQRQVLAAEMEVLELKTRLTVMQAAAEGQVKITTAEVDATVQKVVQQIAIDLEAQRKEQLGQVDIGLDRQRKGMEIDLDAQRVQAVGAAEVGVQRQQVDVEAERVQRVAQAEMEVERARRQSDFLTEQYLRELLIKSGGGAIGADAAAQAGKTLADGLAGIFGRKK